MVATSPQVLGSGTSSTRFRGCSNISEYDVLAKLGEGTFGEVHKARSKRSGKVVALKKILMHNEKDGFPITALREIKLLKMLDHVNILRLEEMAVERAMSKEKKKAIMYMVTPYMDHDLSGLLENPSVNFTEAQIKCYMLQLLEGVRYLHDSHILHRDMKAANLLINNRGVLQIADFGLARNYDEPVPQPGLGGGEARRDYTSLVVTRWYRPPELLLSLRKYTTAIDLWGVGCVFGEMFKRRPILAGKSDLNQVQIIFELVGSPTEESMPGWSSLPGCEGVTSFSTRTGNLSEQFNECSPGAISLLTDLLRLDWRKRITAIDALEHPYFRADPRPAKPESLPRYEDSHELDRRRFRDQKAAPPPAPAGGTVGMGPEGEWAPAHNGAHYPSRPANHDQRWDRNRAPPNPHPPPNPRPAYDHRGPLERIPMHYDRRPPVQKPSWQRDPLPDNLPARPPPPAPRPGEPMNNGNRLPRIPSTKDTYIPSYQDRGERPIRDRDYRDRDRDYARDRRPAGPHDERINSKDMTGMSYDDRRTRSRSPHRDREREKRDRDRDVYRR